MTNDLEKIQERIEQKRKEADSLKVVESIVRGLQKTGEVKVYSDTDSVTIYTTQEEVTTDMKELYRRSDSNKNIEYMIEEEMYKLRAIIAV